LDEDKFRKKKGCWYILYFRKDFKKLVRDERYFEEWDWGVF